MMRNALLSGMVLVCLAAAAGRAQTPPAGAPVIVADKVAQTPAWALKQRELMDVSVQVAREWERVYLKEDGSAKVQFLHGGGVQAPDDFFEAIYKLPLLYALGAGEETWHVYWKAVEGTQKPLLAQGLYKNEMVKYLDWHHNGEQYEGFWLGALCAPHDPEYRRLSFKFAAFYDGSDPSVPNYDPKNKVMRSMLNGGAGPVLKPSREDWDARGGVFWDDWLNCAHDGPANLVTTCFGTNAFLLTGDVKYKTATLDYINAWRDRAKANGGIVPSIVNQDGKVPAEWWGGVMGWDFKPFGGVFQVSSGPRAAWGNALLLTGDKSYYDELRVEADEIWAHRFTAKDGRLDLPRYRGKDGWYGELGNGIQGGGNSAGIYASMVANVYLATMSPEDLDRVLSRPVEGMAGHAEYHEGGYEPQWIRFLVGKNPEWPAKSLDRCLAQSQADLKSLRATQSGPDAVFKDARQSGWAGPLVNQMTGGIMPLWHGQLLLCRFRYFDPERQRPGIPADCAALVETMTDDGATLVLANSSAKDAHTVLVQTGAYAEHQCLSVQPEGGQAVTVGGTLFAVKLAPGAVQRLAVTMKRYTNTPTAALPWDRTP